MAMADSGKKRKRTINATPKSNKKVVIQAPSPLKDITVTLVQDTDKWAPIVVSTPGLSIPSSIELQPYTRRRKNAPSRPGVSGAIATDELLLQSSAHPAIDYVGREESAGNADSLLKHYVGVYDPTTGELQVMEARRIVVRGTVRTQQAAPEALAERSSSSNMRDMRNDLGQTFGTKKAKKAITSITENAISPHKSTRETSPGGSQRTKLDSLSRTLLDSMAGATEGMATREQLSAAVDDAKPRPKANITAETIKDVYPLDILIGKDVVKLLPVKSWQDSINAKKEVVTKSKFVAHRLNKVASDVQKLKALRYLLCLLEFFGAAKAKGRGGRRIPKPEELKAALPDVPPTVIDSIRRKFSVNGEMQKFQIDLLITHACVLACIVDNYEVDMYDLREDLHLEVKEISQYFHEIGARVVPAPEAERKALGLDKAAAMQHKFAKLRLPLDFPKAKFARKTR